MHLTKSHQSMSSERMLTRYPLFYLAFFGILMTARTATVLSFGEQGQILQQVDGIPAVAEVLSGTDTTPPKVYIGPDGVPIYEINVAPDNFGFPGIESGSTAENPLHPPAENVDEGKMEPTKANVESSSDDTKKDQAAQNPSGESSEQEQSSHPSQSSPVQSEGSSQTPGSGSSTGGTPQTPSGSIQSQGPASASASSGSAPENSANNSPHTGSDPSKPSQGNSNDASGNSKSSSGDSVTKGNNNGNSGATVGPIQEHTSQSNDNAKSTGNSQSITEENKPRQTGKDDTQTNENGKDIETEKKDDITSTVSPTTPAKSPESVMNSPEPQETAESMESPVPIDFTPIPSPETENTTSSNAIGKIPEAATPEADIDGSSRGNTLKWAIGGSVAGLVVLAVLIGFIVYRRGNDDDDDDAEDGGESGIPVDDADIGIALDVARPGSAASKSQAASMKELSENLGTTRGIRVPSLRLEQPGMRT